MARYDPPIRATVRGDWMPEGAEGYPALIRSTTDGWAVPMFDRETVERLIVDQEALRRTLGPGAPTIVLDGDVLLFIDGETRRIEPNEDGLYLFDVGWTWRYTPTDPTIRRSKTCRTS